MDQSELDKKYFINSNTYNCPFCKRGSVGYTVTAKLDFDWSNERKVYVYFIKCNNCGKESLHLSDTDFEGSRFSKLYRPLDGGGDEIEDFDEATLDDWFFYHQPTSFFTVDSRVPEPIRNLITEAEGCRKMNYLVGGSGALRKAIYELLKNQAAEGDNYQEKIKWLKTKYPYITKEYFDILANIQDMTSENLHEQDGSWEPWGNKDLLLLITTTKEVIHEIYVRPAQNSEILKEVLDLKQKSSFKDSVTLGSPKKAKK